MTVFNPNRILMLAHAIQKFSLSYDQACVRL